MFDKEPKTIIDTFKSVSESYTVTHCRNGFVVEVNGQNDKGDYLSDRFIFSTLDQLKAAVQDMAWMPRS